MKNGKYSNTRRSVGMKRIWLIAAVIALATVLMGSAIAALVSMKVDDVKVHTQNGETHEGEKIEFEEVHDVFIELGSWYPQEIPDGYAMTFISDGAPLQNQNIKYENKMDFVYNPIYHQHLLDGIHLSHVLNDQNQYHTHHLS